MVVRFWRTTAKLLLPSGTNSRSSETEGVVELSSVVTDIAAYVRNRLANYFPEKRVE